MYNLHAWDGNLWSKLLQVPQQDFADIVQRQGQVASTIHFQFSDFAASMPQKIVRSIVVEAELPGRIHERCNTRHTAFYKSPSLFARILFFLAS